MRKAIILAAAAIALSACTVSKPLSQAALEGENYSDVKLEGYPFMFWDDGCGKSYKFKRVFKATNQSGHRVKGVVCKGWVKGVDIKPMAIQ